MTNDYTGTVGPSKVLSGRLSEPTEKLSGQLRSTGSVSGRFLEMLVGMSAYEIAKKYGFEGSEEEWITSLRGDEVELRNYNDILQWKYKLENDNRWRDLIDLSALDYNDLINKPLVNGVPLAGNTDLSSSFIMKKDFTVMTDSDINTIINRLKGGG